MNDARVATSEPMSNQLAVGREKPATILIVEDESIVAMEIAERLVKMGYAVCGTADNGQEAISLVEQHRPDLVLMDIVIKGRLDGIDTAAHLARRYQTPVIFLTAFGDGATIDRAIQTAPYGYLTKPYQATQLRAAIEVALYKCALEQRLRDSEQWFASTLRCVADGVIATDVDGRICFMNASAEKDLGWKLEAVRGHDVEEILVLQDVHGTRVVPPVVQVLRDKTMGGISFGNFLFTREGRALPVDSSAAPIRNDRDEVIGAVVAFRDISERIAAEDALKHSEERFRTAFDFAPVGMALVALDGRFLRGNAAICNLLKLDPRELLETNQNAITHPDDRENEQRCLLALLVNDVPTLQFEKRYTTEQAAYLWVLTSVSLLKRGDAPVCYLYQVHDLSERKAAERHMMHLAHYDPLTGLANRTRLKDEIDRQIVIARRGNRQLAVVFLDLDYFKQVNDSLGHEAGDRLLQLVAERLQLAVRESDCVARLGGDEFVILLANIESAEDVSVVLSKIQAMFRQSVTLEHSEITVGVSMGVSLFPGDGGDAKTLFKCADSALYLAKDEGRNNIQFYRPELTARVQQRVSLDAALRLAVERQEFELYFQPIVPLGKGQAVSAEVLIRWQHPEKGVLLPGEFIAFAEEVGLIEPIGEWVIRAACKQAGAWATTSVGSIGIAVNVSSRQFKTGDLVQIVTDALASSGLDPSLLTIEITEAQLLQDTERNIATIAALKALGVRIAIDDFGVGYSSLSYIRRLAPDELKIDISFVKEIRVSEDGDSMVAAIISMSRSLRLSNVAEGVETAEQRDFLIEHGCTHAQGYLYAKPLPADEFVSWLTEYRCSSGQSE